MPSRLVPSSGRLHFLSACGSDFAPSGGEANLQPPSIAAVTCDGEHTSPETSIVRAHRDGVHVRLTNSSGGRLVLNYSIDRSSGGGGDVIVPAGVSEQVIPFAASTVGFKCLREEEDDKTMDFALEFESIKVVDPQGQAKAAQPLSCRPNSSSQDSPSSERDGSLVGADPIRLTKSYLRDRGLLEPGDAVEAAVSPGPEFPVVRFVRDGRVIGAFWFAQRTPESDDFSLDAVRLCPSLS
jgi:hypothetical protein